MRFILSFFFLLLLFGCTQHNQTVIPPIDGSIDLNDEHYGIMDTIFLKMEAQGINTRQKMRYGYFFLDNDSLKLEKLKNYLVGKSYEVAGFYQYDGPQFILDMERIESHTRKSLMDEEKEMKSLAQQFGIESYDGFNI